MKTNPLPRNGSQNPNTNNGHIKAFNGIFHAVKANAGVYRNVEAFTSAPSISSPYPSRNSSNSQ